jgi:CRISPR-associated RAMP protein (TIGR02581 family)
MTLESIDSRLHLVGEYILNTPLRISTPGDGLVLDSAGNPLIPASTFRGALRTFIEAVLRGLQTAQHDTLQIITVRGPEGRSIQQQRTVRLCCDSVDKNDTDAYYQGCLTRAIVTKWEADPILRPKFDQTIAQCTCTVCRLFGTPWLAGRVQIPDLTSLGKWDGKIETRAGIQIDRETETQIAGSRYEYRAVPAGSRFAFQLSLNNVSEVEQGMILIGIRAFQQGIIRLGSRRSAGLGAGYLQLDWAKCRQIDADHLIQALLNHDLFPFTEADLDARIAALDAFLKAGPKA